MGHSHSDIRMPRVWEVCGFVSQRHLDKEDYRQVTVFVEDTGTEIREEKGSFQRLVSEIKHVWLEEGEAGRAFRNLSKEIRKNPEIKVDFQLCSKPSECQNGWNFKIFP